MHLYLQYFVIWICVYSVEIFRTSVGLVIHQLILETHTKFLCNNKLLRTQIVHSGEVIASVFDLLYFRFCCFCHVKNFNHWKLITYLEDLFSLCTDKIKETFKSGNFHKDLCWGHKEGYRMAYTKKLGMASQENVNWFDHNQDIL